MIPPLGVTLTPIAGESLMSLIMRHAHANHLPRPADVLLAAGQQNVNIAHVPFADVSIAKTLAGTLSLPVEEILSRLHLTDPVSTAGTAYKTATYFGGEIRRVHLETKTRRVAVRAFDESLHLRGEWSIRALPFSGETFELLRAHCWNCGSRLGWGPNSCVHECNKCCADLRRSPIDYLPHNLRDACGQAAGLVSWNPARRAAALTAFGEDFRDWNPCELFGSIVECGLAETRLGEPVAARNRKLGSGDFVDVTPDDIAAGVAFMGDLEHSLEHFARRAYAQFGSTSLSRGFGPLGKYLGSHRQQQFSTPLGVALRSVWPAAAGRANLPLRKWSKATVVLTVERGNSYSMMEAAARIGTQASKLALLKGKSPTFLTQAYDRGGTALFDRKGVDELAAVFASSMSNDAAAKTLRLPREVVDYFALNGLLSYPDSSDEALMRKPYRRITRASVVALMERLKLLSLPIEVGERLSDVLGTQGGPEVWLWACQALLSKSLQGSGFKTAGSTSFGEVTLGVEAERLVMAQIKERGKPFFVNGIRAGRLLGTSGQFVGAAVSAGLIKGAMNAGRLTISIEEVERFSERYVLPAEAASALKCKLKQAKRLLASVGVRPVALMFRVNVYDRKQFEVGMLRLQQRKKADDS